MSVTGWQGQQWWPREAGRRESSDGFRSSGAWWTNGAVIRGPRGEGDEPPGLLEDERCRSRRGRPAWSRGLRRWWRHLGAVAVVDVVRLSGGDQSLERSR